MLLQAAAAVFLAGSGAGLLAVMLLAGDTAATHSWAWHASPTPAQVYSDEEKAQGTGLYY